MKKIILKITLFIFVLAMGVKLLLTYYPLPQPEEPMVQLYNAFEDIDNKLEQLDNDLADGKIEFEEYNLKVKLLLNIMDREEVLDDK